MIIEYQIRRSDIPKAYLYSLQHSARARWIVFGATTVLVGYSLMIRYMAQGIVKAGDFLDAFIMAAIFIIGLPAISMVTAKTQKRTLLIGSEGLETTIGTREGKIPWKSVETIQAADERVFILGKFGNALTIPGQAFITKEQREIFLELANQYLQQSRQPSAEG